MNKLKRLAYWKSIANDAVRAAGREGVAEFEAIVYKNEDDLFSFFDCFRPDGVGLERVFAGVVGGDEILQRLRRIYSLKETNTAFGYFVVRRPALADDERLLHLAAQHLDKIKQIATAFDAPELVTDLNGIRTIQIARGEISQEVRCDFSAPEASIYEITGDWFRDLQPMESEALLLQEAFYSIACDYKIAQYLMWPLYRSSTTIEDPFAPYFELWTLGALPFFEKPGLVNVYVSPVH